MCLEEKEKEKKEKKEEISVSVGVKRVGQKIEGATIVDVA